MRSEGPGSGRAAGPPTVLDTGDEERWGDPELLALAEVRELFLVLGKALRAYQLYDRQNPVYQRFRGGLVDAFRALWRSESGLSLLVEENRLTWRGEEVYRSEQRSDSLAFLLYRDGVRELQLLRGIEEEELEGLLDVLHRARHARTDADDLVTLLWDQDFQYLRYEVVDLLADGVVVPEPGDGVLAGSALGILSAEGFTLLEPHEVPGAPDDSAEEDPGREATEAEAPPLATAPPEGAIRVDDFNPTLHALEPEDRSYVEELVEAEERRSLRIDVLNALFDRFEEAGRPDRQREIAGIIGQLLPNLLSRGWMREVGFMLGELEAIRRQGVVDADALALVDDALTLLASPESVAELVRAMEDGSLTSSSGELAAFLRHLRDSALAPLLRAVESTAHPPVRRRLQDAIREIARASPDGVLALLRSDDELVVAGAVRLVGTLGLPQASLALGKLLLTAPLPVRRAVVETAAELPVPELADPLAKTLFHEDRDLRIGAARALAATGHGPSIALMEEILASREFRDTDVTEKVAVFEAYARLAGARGVPVLDRLLNRRGLFGYREPPGNRAGAARALGIVGTPSALTALRKAERDPDPVVRTAVGRALAADVGGSGRASAREDE